MITPAYGLTATERVLPRLALDWTTGLAQPGVDVVRSGVSTFVGSNGLIQLASTNTQRVDYSMDKPGLLVEESRVNRANYSEQFDNASWVKGGSTVTANQAVAPDGTATMDKLVETATTGFHFMQLQQVINSGTTYTSSIFAKRSERNWLRMAFSSSVFPSTGRSAVFDLENGVVGEVQSGVTATIKPFSDGVYRCSITATATGSSTATDATAYMLVTQNTATAESYTGDGTSGLFIWGAQFEAGAFPTSYIPTEGSAVTRNTDVATITGTNFSDWWNPEQGTFVVEGILFTTATSGIITVDDTTTSNRIQLRGLSNSTLTLVYAGGVSQASIVNGSWPVNTVGKASLAYKLNDYIVSAGAALPSTDNSALVPSVTRLGLGSPDTQAPINGYLRKLLYYPQRLTNNEVQSFSK